MSGYGISWSNFVSKINIFANDKQNPNTVNNASSKHGKATKNNKRIKKHHHHHHPAVPPLGKSPKLASAAAPQSPRGLIKPLNKINATTTVLANTKATFKDNWIFEDIDDFDYTEFDKISFEDVEEQATLENQIYSNTKIFQEKINTNTIHTKWNHKLHEIDPSCIREIANEYLIYYVNEKEELIENKVITSLQLNMKDILNATSMHRFSFSSSENNNSSISNNSTSFNNNDNDDDDDFDFDIPPPKTTTKYTTFTQSSFPPSLNISSSPNNMMGVGKINILQSKKQINNKNNNNNNNDDDDNNNKNHQVNNDDDDDDWGDDFGDFTPTSLTNKLTLPNNNNNIITTKTSASASSQFQPTITNLTQLKSKMLTISGDDWDIEEINQSIGGGGGSSTSSSNTDNYDNDFDMDDISGDDSGAKNPFSVIKNLKNSLSLSNHVVGGEEEDDDDFLEFEG